MASVERAVVVVDVVAAVAVVDRTIATAVPCILGKQGGKNRNSALANSISDRMTKPSKPRKAGVPRLEPVNSRTSKLDKPLLGRMKRPEGTTGLKTDLSTPMARSLIPKVVLPTIWSPNPRTRVNHMPITWLSRLRRSFNSEDP